MLQLILSSVKDSLLLLILPTLIGLANADFRDSGIYDSNYVCNVYLQEVEFFARKDDWDGSLGLVSTDSTYLTRVFDGYFDEFSKQFIKSVADNNFAGKFLEFHYGRFTVNGGDININVASHPILKPFRFSLKLNGEIVSGTKQIPYAFVDTTEHTDSLVQFLGFKRFFAFFVVAHEIVHFRDYLQNKKDITYDNRRAEYKVDIDAMKFIVKYKNDLTPQK